VSIVEPALPRAAGRRAHPPRQPVLGLLGLLFVVPIATALAGGAGAEGSVRVLAPLTGYSLPLIILIAFWWEDWPGTRLRARWTGWVDTALVAAGAIVLTGTGQALAGRLDPIGIFDPAAGPDHVPTFPLTLPLAGTAFIAMLEITLVGEGWPLRRLRPMPGGLVAFALSWIIALAVCSTLVDIEAPTGSDLMSHGPVPAAQLGAVLVLIGGWQVLCCVTWRGWPFAAIGNRTARLVSAHATVLGGGLLSYGLTRLLGFGPTRTAAVAGCFITAGLLLGMLFDGWLGARSTRLERATLLLATLGLTVLLTVALDAIADTMHFTRISADDWVEHASLNADPASIILHVAIGQRWPFLVSDGRTPAAGTSSQAREIVPPPVRETDPPPAGRRASG
jgi:hypothetical protein